MNTRDWLVHQLGIYIKHEPGFKNRALLERTQDLVKEQAKRIRQARLELDGRIWNHKKW